MYYAWRGEEESRGRGNGPKEVASLDAGSFDAASRLLARK